MPKLKLFKFLPFLVLLMACASENNSNRGAVLEENFLPNEQKIFRGIQIGMDPEGVLQSWKFTPVINTDTLVVYKEKSSWKKHEIDVHLYFLFDDFGLFEIQIDYLPSSNELSAPLFNEIQSRLTENYGSFENLGGMSRGTTMSESNNLVEITLSDESKDSGFPFISLNYLEPLDDEI